MLLTANQINNTEARGRGGREKDIKKGERDGGQQQSDSSGCVH